MKRLAFTIFLLSLSAFAQPGPRKTFPYMDSGTAAELPVTCPVPSFYLATDTRNLYVCLANIYIFVSSAGGGFVTLAPSADQILLGGFDLINDSGGGFTAADSGNTTATLSLQMNQSNPGQGQVFYSYPTGSITSNLRFNTSGAIVLNPASGGADDGGHGVVIGQSGVYIAGAFTDGNSLTLSQGNLAIAGGSLATGNPLLILGSAGVEGVIQSVPSSGGGSYTLRFPATALTNAINLPSLTGTLQITNVTAFASLPSCTSGIEGTLRSVSDSNTLTWGANIAGSSTNHVLAYCDGTNWTVAAK